MEPEEQAINQESDDPQEQIDSNDFVIVDTRSGNSDINKQLERDIDMLVQAVVNYGCLESDKVKAHSLLKSILLLYFGDICYRDKQDNSFHSWSELKKYSKLDAFPIAAVLLHGSRALIEFPSEISVQLIDWLITDKASWRYVATHGIQKLTESEQESLPNGLKKSLKEVKVNIFNATTSLLVKPVMGLANYAYSAVSAVLPMMAATGDEKDSSETSSCLEDKPLGHYAEHYGINLALGGAGNQNFASKETISNNVSVWSNTP